ncbi:MAG: TonB family protein [Campylobacterota bacterium]|nr:TonB family protein [Campylobacterota bacterium]
MFEHRHSISYILTTLLYLGIISGYYIVQKNSINKVVEPREKKIQLNITQFIPPPPVETVEEIEPIKEVEPPKPEPIVEKKPEPLPIKKIVKPKTIKTIPILKPSPTPIKKVKPTVKPKKKIIKKVKKKKPNKKKVKKKIIKKVKQSTRSTKKSTTSTIHKKTKKQNSASKANARNLFYAKLRNKINNNKSYPRMAKKRGMQGKVNVSFRLLKNGRITNLKITGSSLFKKSARKAVEASFPVSVKNIGFSLPDNVSFSINYRLR